jgi:hypothetical protein
VPEPPAEVLAHYARTDENGRLLAGPGPLERARSEEVILRHLPAAPARVLDVGGGPGPYACWLARLGHEVRLIDPVLPAEAREAGFEVVELLGLEGPGWMLSDFRGALGRSLPPRGAAARVAAPPQSASLRTRNP